VAVQELTQNRADIGLLPFLGPVAAVLGTCCLTLAVLIGNIGFQGDDWWQFSWPYWHPFPWSVWEYAKESRRPIEGIYTVLTFESFGLNRIWYTLVAALLAAAATLLMGTCLRRAFPSRISMAVLAVMAAFLLTPASNLIYMFHTDNSRLSLLLFWLSANVFQRWALVSGSRLGLFLPVLIYCSAAMTYENTTFLVFAVPLLVWPLRDRFAGDLSPRSLMFRLAVGIVAGFSAFVAVRFLVLSGGAVGHRSLIPPLGLIVDYLHYLAVYTAMPVIGESGDAASWAWGGMVGLLTGALLYWASRREKSEDSCHGADEPGNLYVAVLGLGILGLGMLPYLLAGYTPGIGLTSHSRVYSSATFGLAIVLALLASWRRPRQRDFAGRGIALAFVVLMAVFLADLRGDWQQAAEKRDSIMASLMEQAPGVKDGTTFLFLDLQSYISREGIPRAVVFQGVDGLAEFIRMAYGKKDVYAYFLYPENASSEEDRKAVVSKEGLRARGSALRPPIPLDSLLIFKREGDKLVLLDQISADEQAAAILWNGVRSIHSNRTLIRPDAKPGSLLQRLAPGDRVSTPTDP